MFIELSKDRALKSDRYCYKLCERRVIKKGKNKGKIEWRSYKYYSSLRSVIKLLPEQLLRESSATGLADVLNTLASFEGRIRELLDNNEGDKK